MVGSLGVNDGEAYTLEKAFIIYLACVSSPRYAVPIHGEGKIPTSHLAIDDATIPPFLTKGGAEIQRVWRRLFVVISAAENIGLQLFYFKATLCWRIVYCNP
jgi:hypothetical protein